MLIIAVGAPLLAWWRLSQVSKHATELVTEVGRLICKRPRRRAGRHRHGHRRPAPTPTARPMPAIIETRQFSRLRQSALDGQRPAPAARRPACRDDVPVAAADRRRADARVRRPRLPVPDRLDRLTDAHGSGPGSSRRSAECRRRQAARARARLHAGSARARPCHERRRRTPTAARADTEPHRQAPAVDERARGPRRGPTAPTRPSLRRGGERRPDAVLDLGGRRRARSPAVADETLER